MKGSAKSVLKPPLPPLVPCVDKKLMGWVLGELSQIRYTELLPFFTGGGAPALDFSCLSSYIYTSQNRALVSKNPLLAVQNDTRARAIEQHLLDEARCAVFNEKLLQPNRRERDELERVKTSIAGFTRRFWQYFAEAPIRFGPGVALLDAASKHSGYTPDKLENPCSTLKLYEYMRTSSIVGDHPFFFAWFTRPGNNISFMKESTEVFFTVPKDTVTDRGCSKQPSVNMTIQLMIGYALRMCLRDLGILIESVKVGNLVLENQADYHGSILPTRWDDVATIDLKSASNTISRELVRLVFPKAIYSLMDAARCSSIDIDGEVTPLERFSAMGNGFTFELESLLFYAISSIATGGEHDHDFRSGSSTVFGDDIIVAKTRYQDVLDKLKLLGFEVNTSKSFGSGPFRESCGVDVYEGVLCRPVFLKELQGPLGFVTLHNLIVKLAKLGDSGYDVRYRRLLLQLRAKAPRVPLGPVGSDDDTYFQEPTFTDYRPLKLRVGNMVITDKNQSGHSAIRLKTKRVKPQNDHYYTWMWIALGLDSEGYGLRDATRVCGTRFKRSERTIPSPWV